MREDTPPVIREGNNAVGHRAPPSMGGLPGSATRGCGYGTISPA